MRPKARPVIALVQTESRIVAASIVSLIRPRPRPNDLATALPNKEIRPQAVAMTPLDKSTIKSKKGSVCGDPAIKGEVLAAITSATKGCGVAEPVRITSVDGVKLSQPAIMDCNTAKALKTWVRKGLQPAFSNNPVIQLNVAAHYICRPRNNVKGAKISEHGRGKAIDISGLILSDGTLMTVTENWGRVLRRVYKSACGIFSTTLGPGSDGYHEDHMHFDTARYRGGAYCH
jgi:hypothetical protein